MSDAASNDPYIQGENYDLIDLDSLEDDSASFQSEEGKAKRRKRSNVWCYFDMVQDSNKFDANIGKPRAKCKMCGVTYMVVSKYRIENLKHHIDTCPKRNSRNIGQLMLQNDGLVSASKFDVEKFSELVVAMIVKHELPFRFVEYSGFRSLCQYLCPDCPQISRNTSKATLLKRYHQEKKKVKCMLNDAIGRISLTCDLWTSITTDDYMCITAHFLDKKWVLQKRVLNFFFIPPPYNDISLSEKIYNLLCEWRIENKIFTLTLDNASSNNVSVEMLRTQLNIKKAIVCDGEFFHLRCFAHILNLIVQDGLKEIDCAIQKIRESIKYIKGSQERKEKFLESTNQMSLDSKKGLRQDVPTRWNSTFLMLESAIFYRRAFWHLELTDSNFKQHCLSSNEWDKVEKINELLAIFYEATKCHSVNLYFPAICMIYWTLKQQCESEDDFMRKMASQMIAKFEKYWSKFNVMLVIATILDPRYKLDFVEFFYKKFYGHGSLEHLNVRAKMESLFIEYTSSAPTISKTNVGKVDTPQFRSFTKEALIKEFEEYLIDHPTTHVHKSQLELYFDEPRIDTNASLDILSFWKENEFRYPDLACMARDILSIHISTVASESIFSVDGRIIDQFKSALKPNIVEALICTRDWLYGQQEIQEMNLDELIEDVMRLDIDKSKEDTSLPSTFVNV